MPRTGEDITRLLEAAALGDGGASDELFARVGSELKDLARREVARWSPGQTLQATALVSEAYLRIFGRVEGRPTNRRFFYAAAARVMHDVMIEGARRRARRGVREPMPTGLAAPRDPVDLEQLKTAIRAFEDVDARAADVFRMRILLGLPFDEIASSIGTSVPTVERDLRYARTWLRRALADGGRTGGDE